MKRNMLIKGSLISVAIVMFASFSSAVFAQQTLPITKLHSTQPNDNKYNGLIESIIKYKTQGKELQSVDITEVRNIFQLIKEDLTNNSWYPGFFIEVLLSFGLLLILYFAYFLIYYWL